MAGDKIEATFTINHDMQRLLERAAEKYELPDASKALRVILDFIAYEADMDRVFTKIRCKRCSSRF